MGIAPTFDHVAIRGRRLLRPGRPRAPAPVGPSRLLPRSARRRRRHAGPGAEGPGPGGGRAASASERPRAILPEGGIHTPGPERCDALDVGYVFETDMADGVFAVLSDRLAPKGYAYLLVCRGWGTVASCLFDDYANAREYRERAREFFEKHAGLRMRAERTFGGHGQHARGARSPRRGEVLYAGEAAGLQDALWGFGMRFALVSGHMAARALRRKDAPRLRDGRSGSASPGFCAPSVVNRYIYERHGRLRLRVAPAPDRAGLGRPGLAAPVLRAEPLEEPLLSGGAFRRGGRAPPRGSRGARRSRRVLRWSLRRPGRRLRAPGSARQRRRLAPRLRPWAGRRLPAELNASRVGPARGGVPARGSGCRLLTSC